MPLHRQAQHSRRLRAYPQVSSNKYVLCLTGHILAHIGSILSWFLFQPSHEVVWCPEIASEDFHAINNREELMNSFYKLMWWDKQWEPGPQGSYFLIRFCMYSGCLQPKIRIMSSAAGRSWEGGEDWQAPANLCHAMGEVTASPNQMRSWVPHWGQDGVGVESNTNDAVMKLRGCLWTWAWTWEPLWVNWRDMFKSYSRMFTNLHTFHKICRHIYIHILIF